MWRERWKDGIMGGGRRGFSFRFYLLIAWGTAAVTELRFKTTSVHLHTFPNDAFSIHQHQPFIREAERKSTLKDSSKSRKNFP